MTDIDKYNLTVWVYKNCLRSYVGQRWHKHHIRPKSIYPEFKDDPENIVAVPDIVHWALHEWLNKHLKDSGNCAYDRLKFADVATFINDCSPYKIDFSRRDEILEFIITEVKRFAVDFKSAQDEFASDTAALEDNTRGSFIFKGSGFLFRDDMKIPGDLDSFISENYKRLIDKHEYGFRFKNFRGNKDCDVSVLISRMKNAGFPCFTVSKNKIGCKNGYGHLLEYTELWKPKMRRPDRTMLCRMFFEVYNRFKQGNIDEINTTDSNIDAILSEISPDPLAELAARIPEPG